MIEWSTAMEKLFEVMSHDEKKKFLEAIDILHKHRGRWNAGMIDNLSRSHVHVIIDQIAAAHGLDMEDYT